MKKCHISSPEFWFALSQIANIKTKIDSYSPNLGKSPYRRFHSVPTWETFPGNWFAKNTPIFY